MKFYILSAVFILLIFSLIGCSTHTEKKETDANEKNIITEIDTSTIAGYSPAIGSKQINFVHKFTNIELGKGFNSATGEITGNVVKYDHHPQEINVIPDRHVNYDFDKVEDLYDLVRKFDLDASASIKYFNFNVNSSLALSNSLHINQYHQFLAARIYVTDRDSSLKKISLTPEAYRLAKRNIKSFIEQNGDQVVTSKVMGGDLIVLLEITSLDQKESDLTKAHVDAAVSAFTGSAHAAVDISNALTSIRQTNSYKLKVIEDGEIDSTKYTDLASIIQLINNFPSEIHRDGGNPIEYKMSAIYNGVDNLPPKVSSSAFLSISNQAYQLKTIDNNIIGVLITLADLQYVKDHPKLFLKSTVDSATDIYSKNYGAYLIYLNNRNICEQAPNLCNKCQQFKYKLPVFKPNVSFAQKPDTEAVPIPISYNWRVIDTIPVGKTYNISLQGKVQYNAITPLDCRVPAFNSEDLDYAALTTTPFGNQVVHSPYRLMPVVAFQYADMATGAPIGAPFLFSGRFNTLPSATMVVLEARMDIIWTLPGPGGVPLLQSISILAKTSNIIPNFIFNCSNNSPLSVVVIRRSSAAKGKLAHIKLN